MVLALGVLTIAIPAKVLGADQVEQLIRRGVDLRRAGHDDQALEVFRSAYQMRPNPRAQAQMGLAEQALGQWADAEKDLSAALQAARDPWIASNAATLRRSVTTVKQHLGSLQVVGSPAGARVRVDERDVGTLPIETPVRVTAGEILVSVSAPGYIEINRKLTVAAGSLARDVITLHAVAPSDHDVAQARPGMRKRAAAPGPEDKPASAPPPSLPTRLVDRESDASGAPARGLTTSQWWAVGIGAAGVVAGGVGTVFTVQAISKNRESGSGCVGDVCGQTGAQARRQALTAGNRATVAFVASGVLIAGGVAMFFLGRPSADSPSALRITPEVGSGGVALVGTARF